MGERRQKYTWTDFFKLHTRNAFCIFVAIKLVMGLQNIIYQKPVFDWPKVDYRLEDIYDEDRGTFTLLDKTDVRFTLKPRQGCFKEKFVIVALSAPENTQKREIVRSVLENYDEVKLIFLLGKVSSSHTQQQLQTEQLMHGDILQNTVIDTYYTLVYKSLSAFIWTSRYCNNAEYVIKIDDDVQANFDAVLGNLKAKYPGRPPPILECPGIMRNMRPWRHNNTKTVMGKWSVSRSVMSRRVHPDFCPGWLYVITPEVGLGLVHVARDTVDELKELSTMDDIYITGFLRERLPWVKLEQLQPGLWGWVWRNCFSHCPLMGIFKNTFFNEFVNEKGSGQIHYIKGKKFIFCAFLEYFILDNLNSISPSLAPNYIVEYCARKN